MWSKPIKMFSYETHNEMNYFIFRSFASLFPFLFCLYFSESVISLSLSVLNMVEWVCVRLILMPCARNFFSVSSLWSDEQGVGLW